MLFKFKSQATADLIMLEADARRLLKIMLGHDPVKGVLTWQDMPAVLDKIEQAVVQEDALRQAAAAGASAEAAQAVSELPAVRLAQRAAPMQQMLRRSLAEERDIVWGL